MRDVSVPSLLHRFTLLRAASGDPISLGDLKTRLVEQRARGTENHLSEEGMDTFLQTLGRLRSKPSASSTSGDSINGLAYESLRSTETTPVPSRRAHARQNVTATICLALVNSEIILIFAAWRENTLGGEEVLAGAARIRHRQQ